MMEVVVTTGLQCLDKKRYHLRYFTTHQEKRKITDIMIKQHPKMDTETVLKAMYIRTKWSRTVHMCVNPQIQDDQTII